MMIDEFEEIAGFRPTQEQYREIEKIYAQCGEDKQTFCKKWRKTGKQTTFTRTFHFEGRRHTNKSLMEAVFEIAESMPEFARAADILDYKLIEERDVVDVTNYGYEFRAVANFGTNEGIYIDCFLDGRFCDNPNKTKISMGTLKTLGTSLEHMRSMGELAGILTWVERDFVNRNINQFTPEGEKTLSRRWEIEHIPTGIKL
jgi:hypothetical protein